MGDNNHFMVCIVDAKTDTIRLPDSFAEQNGGLIENAVTLRTRDYMEWVIHVDKLDGEIWLSVGWKEFAKDNGNKNSFLVYFEYVGDTVFLVSIFHKAGVEKPRPGYPLERLPAKFFKCVKDAESLHQLEFSEKFSIAFAERLGSPIFLIPGDGPIWPVHWRIVNGNICIYGGWRGTAAHLSIEIGDICLFGYQGDSNITMVVCKRNRGQITQSEHRLIVDAPQLTLWTTVVNDHILNRSKPLYIPAFVVKEYFSHKPKKVDVMVPSGKIEQWSLIWSNQEANKGYLGHGWYDFVIDYKLELNQKLRFFQADLEDLIHVEII